MQEIDSNSLIKHFEELQEVCDLWNPLKNKISYKIFTNRDGTLEGIGHSTAIKKIANKIFDYNKKKPVTINEDFAGLYLFSKDSKPFYCGISRNVIKRILDHQKGSTKSMATLAQRIAKNKNSDTSEHKYLEAFNGERAKLLDCEISLIKFYDPDYEAYKNDKMTQHKEEIMLYLFEVFVSVHYNTEHNSFRTH